MQSLIMTGILFGVILAVYEAKFVDINKTHLLDGAMYAIILSILGARLYYVFFLIPIRQIIIETSVMFLISQAEEWRFMGPLLRR